MYDFKLNVFNNRYTAVDQTDRKIILALTRRFLGLVAILSLAMSTHRDASRFWPGGWSHGLALFLELVHFFLLYMLFK